MSVTDMIHQVTQYNRNQTPVTSAKLVQRCGCNPIVKSEDIPGGAACVFNSGVVRHGELWIMLINAWDTQWAPKFLVATSLNGVHFDINPKNHFVPPAEYPYVKHEGIFDTRITPLEDAYYITYNVASRLGGRIRLARTTDFASFEDMGFITAPDHRNCVLFPEKINGNYARLERPNVDGAGDIYVSYSPDLIHWGQTSLVFERNHRYWASAKIGPGAPPIRTDAGWLLIFHGARQGMNGYTYQAGAMIVDINDPSKVLGVMNDCLLAPEELYERVGVTPNVVFPTGVCPVDNELVMYYGAADTVMCRATMNLSQLIEACMQDSNRSH